MIRLKVETVLSESGTEMIRRFWMGGRVREVVENIDRWHGEGYRYFKVKADDDYLYILRFDEATGDWELIQFKPPPEAPKSLH